MDKKERQGIVITFCALSQDKDMILATSKDDATLARAIASFGDNLKNKGGEVFMQKDNIIVTDTGYYFAFFEEDLELAKKVYDRPH